MAFKIRAAKGSRPLFQGRDKKEEEGSGILLPQILHPIHHPLQYPILHLIFHLILYLILRLILSSSSPNSSSNSSSNSSFNISSNPGTDQTPARSYIHHEQPDQTDTGYNKRIRISDDIYDSLQEFGKRHQTKKLFRNIATLASEQRRTCEAKTTWKDSDRISPI